MERIATVLFMPFPQTRNRHDGIRPEAVRKMHQLDRMAGNQPNAVDLSSEDQKIRAFVGFPMSTEVVQAIAALINDMKARVPGNGISWVDPHNVHLTVRFLGDGVGLHMITPLVAVLTTIAAETQPFAIQVQGLGVFPNSQRPRTVWVGIVSEKLKELAVRVDRAAAQCGFYSEARPFIPHITVARLRKVRHWKVIREGLGDVANLTFGSFTVDHISIYRSFREAQGRIYEEIASFPLSSR